MAWMAVATIEGPDFCINLFKNVMYAMGASTTATCPWEQGPRHMLLGPAHHANRGGLNLLHSDVFFQSMKSHPATPGVWKPLSWEGRLRPSGVQLYRLFTVNAPSRKYEMLSVMHVFRVMSKVLLVKKKKKRKRKKEIIPFLRQRLTSARGFLNHSKWNVVTRLLPNLLLWRH